MRLIIMVICLALFMSFILHTAYAEDSVIKEQLLELEALIDEEPSFLFRDGIHGKFLFKQELNRAILLVEDNKLEEAGSVIHRLLIEIEGRLIITNPISRDNIRQRLIEILTKITQDLQDET